MSNIWCYDEWKRWNDAGKPNDSNLTILSLHNNQLTQIDVSNLTNLTHLYLYNNQLTQIDVSNLTNLTHLSLSFNQLTQIDVSNLINLTKLCVNNNPISQPLYYSYNIYDIKIITYNNYRCYIATDFL